MTTKKPSPEPLANHIPKETPAVPVEHGFKHVKPRPVVKLDASGRQLDVNGRQLDVNLEPAK